MLRHRKPLPEALVAPFRQTPQQRERSRLEQEQQRVHYVRYNDPSVLAA